MKTRVERWFNHQLGVMMYRVQFLDYWRDFELREAYPDSVVWQTAKNTPDKEEAIRTAIAIADNGDLKGVRDVVAEYGQSDLVEKEGTYVPPKGRDYSGIRITAT